MAATLQQARADFLAKVADAGAGADAKVLLEIARPALIYRPAASPIERDPSLLNRPDGATNEDDIPIGATKIGGRPDLPAAVAWPAPTQAFVVQFDLTRVPPDVIDLDLPREGHLLFFVDPDDTANGTLLWLGPYHTSLQRTEPPDSATLFLPRRVTHEIALTLDLGRPEVPAYDPRQDDLFEALALPDPDETVQLGGDAQTLNSLSEACAARAGDPPENMTEADAQWRLILRVGAVAECEMAWDGSLFVWMRLGDLRERRFENAVVVLDVG